MKSKIALMTILMLTLPLAGCIEGSDVAGAVQTGGDGSTDSTTTWSNQTTYVNETQIIHQTVYMPERDIRIASGYAGECSVWENTSSGQSTCTQSDSAEPGSITMLTIPANTTATILAASGYGDGVYVSITCASGWTKSQGTSYHYLPMHLPQDGSGCTVTNAPYMEGYWSVTYELLNATVV